MTSLRPIILQWGMILFALSPIHSAQEPKLSTAGAPYAPYDVSKKSQEYSQPLSGPQRDELLSEFTGLVHLGLHTVSYERWKGKEMADCEKPEKGEARWSWRCEIITGQGNAYYFFYPNASRTSDLLKQIDVRVHASDEALLDDFRRPVQQMFGKATFVEKPTAKAKPSGPIRQWTTSTDSAELFMDQSIRPEGSVRFVWIRN